MKIGDKIRIKPINSGGLSFDTIAKHGDVYIIFRMAHPRTANCNEIDVVSAKTDCHFTLTERYYEIEVLNEYVPIELPMELFTI